MRPEQKVEDELPEDVVKTIRKKIIPHFKKKLNARALLPIKEVDPKTREYGYWNDTEDNSQDAAIVMPGGSIPRDKADTKDRIMNMIIKNARGYELSREDYMNREFLNRETLKCTRKVAEKDDDVIINGSVKGDVLGLDGVPYQSLSPQNGTWDDHTDTGAQPYNDIAYMVKKLRSQSSQAFGMNPKGLTLAIGGLAESELHTNHKAESSTDQATLKRIANYVGRVVTIPTIPTGSVYLMETGREIGEYIVAEDITVEAADYEKEDQTYYGNVFCRTLPLWYQHGDDPTATDAIIEMEGVIT